MRRLALLRRLAALTAVACALLGAASCGGSDADGPTSTALAESGADGSDSDPAECRDVEHELGTSCVPAEPKRIVVLDSLMALPTLVEAGAPVVAATSVYDVGEPFPGYLDSELVDEIEVVGSLQEPNLELIAAAQPDLIIGSEPVVEPILAQLEQLAPTVTTRYSFYEPGWLDDVRLVGDVAGVSQEVEASIAELEAQIDQVADELADGAPRTLTRVDMFQGQALLYQYACTWFGSLLDQVGVVQPEQQVKECTPGEYSSVITYLSPEEFALLDADALVTYQQQTSSGELDVDASEVLRTFPLWSELPVVERGDVVTVGDAWGLGVSVPAAREILSDLTAEVFPTDTP